MGVPLSTDQKPNILRAEQLGYAIHLDWDSISGIITILIYIFSPLYRSTFTSKCLQQKFYLNIFATYLLLLLKYPYYDGKAHSQRFHRDNRLSSQRPLDNLDQSRRGPKDEEQHQAGHLSSSHSMRYA